MRWTSFDVDNANARIKDRGREVINTLVPEVKNKYNNKKTVVGGIKFDSQKEAVRWIELIQLQKAGVISNLQRQVKFELNEGGTFSFVYIADFVYWKQGRTVVEDCKGFKTAVYKKKKKLMLKVHHIEILET